MFIDKLGKKSLPDDESTELSNIISKMGKIYGAAKVCLQDKSEECYNLGKGTKASTYSKS